MQEVQATRPEWISLWEYLGILNEKLKNAKKRTQPKAPSNGKHRYQPPR